MEQTDSWKTRTLLVGAFVGAIAGIAAAMIVVERARRENTQPSMSPGDGVKVGLGVLGLMRLIADLGDRQ